MRGLVPLRGDPTGHWMWIQSPVAEMRPACAAEFLQHTGNIQLPNITNMAHAPHDTTRSQHKRDTSLSQAIRIAVSCAPHSSTQPRAVFGQTRRPARDHIFVEVPPASQLAACPAPPQGSLLLRCTSAGKEELCR